MLNEIGPQEIRIVKKMRRKKLREMWRMLLHTLGCEEACPEESDVLWLSRHSVLQAE